MAYADQQMSGNKVTGLVVVAILHVIVGYALVTGLAYSAFKKVKDVTSAIEIKEEKPPEEPPPPPPKQEKTPPPIVAPPPPININPAPPPVQTVITPPPAPPVVITTAAPPAPPPPPAPSKAKGASVKGNWTQRFNQEYPPSALRQEKEGTVGVRVQVGPDGRVTSCSVTSSSGTPDLDAAACAGMQRFGKFNPAIDSAGNPTSDTYSTRISYKLT